MTAKFGSGEVLRTTCHIGGIVGHFGFAIVAVDAVAGQFVSEDKRMPATWAALPNEASSRP